MLPFYAKFGYIAFETRRTAIWLALLRSAAVMGSSWMKMLEKLSMRTILSRAFPIPRRQTETYIRPL